MYQVFLLLMVFISIFVYPETEDFQLQKKTLYMIPTEEKAKKKEIDSLYVEAYRQIENSNSVLYFELPDTLDDTDPEEVLTFGKKVNNKALLENIKKLMEKGRNEFMYKPSNCKLLFSNAFVFYSDKARESILFSQNCGVLKLREQNIYLNFLPYSVELDSIFRDVRRLR
jgi:hypothetical protein